MVFALHCSKKVVLACAVKPRSWNMFTSTGLVDVSYVTHSCLLDCSTEVGVRVKGSSSDVLRVLKMMYVSPWSGGHGRGK